MKFQNRPWLQAQQHPVSEEYRQENNLIADNLYEVFHQWESEKVGKAYCTLYLFSSVFEIEKSGESNLPGRVAKPP